MLLPNKKFYSIFLVFGLILVTLVCKKTTLPQNSKKGVEVKAGQRLGVTDMPVFDMGAMVKTINLPFLDPRLYGLLTLHCYSPIKHFPENIQAALYAKVWRLGSDKDGKAL